MKGLYIHLPFCRQKCSYCDFISFTNHVPDIDAYLKVLEQEMEEYRGTPVDTVFLGGGTPSILSGPQLGFLLQGVRRIFKIDQNAEITIEANPKTLSPEKIKVLLSNGVNRLSLGVQSFVDQELKTIGRIHDAKTAYTTVCMARDLGFNNINLDLMMALPGQTLKSLRQTVETALSLKPEHLSCYSLILEEGTPLYKQYQEGKVTLPKEDTDREMYHFICKRLKENGYEQYEISNFSKSGKQCRHNLKYWQCEQYIGVGIAAHSYLDHRRFANTSDFKEYLSGRFHSEDRQELSNGDEMAEFMIMGLRMLKGVNIQEFERRFNIAIEEQFGGVSAKHVKNGFLAKEGDHYFLTAKGMDVSNTILCDFV